MAPAEDVPGLAETLDAAQREPESSPFAYAALPSPSHIRILELEGALSLADTIKGDLSLLKLAPHENDCTAELDGKMSTESRYEALSYVWGNTETPCTIKINGASLAIGQNLYDALRQFRGRGSRRRLWIDAICINQQDDDERNAQVAMMVEIYRRATRTLVWLGPDSAVGDGQSCLTFFRWLVEGRAPTQNSEGGWLSSSIQQEILRFNSEARSTQMTTSKLVEFARRPYFRRCWVVQEVGVAGQADIWCGQWCLSGTTFGSAAVIILDLGPPYEPSEPLMRLACMNVPSLHPSSEGHVYARGIGRGDSILLLAMLRDFCHFECRDAHDRIASLLWVAPHLKDYRIDYSSTVEEEYIRFATALAQSLGSDILLLLGAAARRLRPQHASTMQLRSWAPDWRVSPRVSFPGIGPGECQTYDGRAQITCLRMGDYRANILPEKAGHHELKLRLKHFEAGTCSFEGRVPAMLRDGDYVLQTCELPSGADDGLGAVVLRRHPSFEDAWTLAGAFSFRFFRFQGWEPARTFDTEFIML